VGAPRTADPAMLRLVAELYYLRDRSQPEIAELTGFSVSKVSRLLATAREEGVVRIEVRGPSVGADPVAAALADALGIEVLVTPAEETSPGLAGRLCGIAAAPAVLARMPEAGVVGIGGGRTIGALVDALATSSRPGLVVVPLVGGWEVRDADLDTNATARRLAARLGGSSLALHAPGVLDSEATKIALLGDSAVRATTGHWERVHLALVGTSGTPTAEAGYPTIMDRLDEAGRQRIRDRGAVGDVAAQLVAFDGSLVDDEFMRRTVAIPLELLRRVPRVILVAAGWTKVEAIVGAARSGLVHTVITDRPTAAAALALVRGIAAGALAAVGR